MFKQRPQTFYAAISCLNNPRSQKLYFIFVRLKLTQSSFRSLHLAEEAEVSISWEASQELTSGQDDNLPPQAQQLQYLRPWHDSI